MMWLRSAAAQGGNRIQDIAAVFLSIAVVATLAARAGPRRVAPPGRDWPVALASGRTRAMARHADSSGEGEDRAERPVGA
jgi:hypothetical protein